MSEMSEGKEGCITVLVVAVVLGIGAICLNACRDPASRRNQQNQTPIQSCVPAKKLNTSSAETEAEITLLKSQLCEQLKLLLEFKDTKEFRYYGFGRGGPYYQWLETVTAMRDSNDEADQIPVPLREAPGELMMIGLEYANNTTETSCVRQMLPELKLKIGY